MRKKIFFAALTITTLGIFLDSENILDPYMSEPLFILGGALLFSSIFLFLVKEDVSKDWLKFTLWWIPLSIFLIVITPDGGGLPPLALTKEFTTYVTAGLFALISLILIISKSVLAKK